MGALGEPLTARRLNVFISYTSEDAELVRTVAEGLETLHHDVWIDKKLNGGQEWWDGILEQIRKCDAMVVAVSPALLESEAAAKEREYARQLGKPLVPVLIAPVLTDLLPPDIEPLQLIDYTTIGPMTGLHLAAALTALPSAPPLPETLPPPPPRPVPPLAELAERLRAEHLSLEDQLAVVAALRLALDRAREQAAAVALLRTLRTRRDLYFAAWQELEDLMQRERAAHQSDGLPGGDAGVRQPPTASQPTTPPGWYPDPSGRHQLRWFDGDWTPYASDNGLVIEDPDF